MRHLFVRPVTIIRPAELTDRTDTIKDWANARRRTTRGWLAQLSSIEVTGNRETQVTSSRLLLPDGADIAAGDRVEVRGEPGQFEVVGDPNREWTPRGGHHVEVDLRRVTG